MNKMADNLQDILGNKNVELQKTIEELWFKIWKMEEEIFELRRDLHYANLKLDVIEEEDESTPTEAQPKEK